MSWASGSRPCDPATGDRIGHRRTGTYPLNGLVAGRLLGRQVVVVSRVLCVDPLRFLDPGDWSDVGLRVGDPWLDRIVGLIDGDPAVLVTIRAGTLRTWRLDGDTWRVRECPYEAAPVTAAATTRRPYPRVGVAYADRTVAVLDPHTGVPVLPPASLPTAAQVLAYGPRGELVAGYDTDVAVLDMAG